MSFLSRRILPSIQHSTRAYSFFSSKSGGGGRFFNSSKPSKAVTQSSSSTSESTEGTNDNQQVSSVASPQQQLLAAPSSTPHVEVVPTLDAITQHPSVDTKDLKLLQFFAGPRPLLLLSHPPSLFQTPSPSTPLFYTAEQRAKLSAQPPYVPETFEPSHEADAEAARQLSRALTMNRAGAAVAWEATLQKLGLDVGQQPDRIGLQEKMDKEWEDVMMDSVKRKRRKKMKKHKLKKRRRETRSQRMKLR